MAAATRGATIAPSADEERGRPRAGARWCGPAGTPRSPGRAGRARCWRRRPRRRRRAATISSTVVASGTSPAASSARPVKAIARASSRRRDSAGSSAGAVRMPTTTPPVSASTSRPKRDRSAAEVLGVQDGDARRRRRSLRRRPRRPAPAAGSRRCGPCRRPPAAFGRRRPSSGERGRGVRTPGSSRKFSDGHATRRTGRPRRTRRGPPGAGRTSRCRRRAGC